VATGATEAVTLGNLEARRDWGHAKRYVETIWRMLQLEEPEDFVIATGELHSVREFCEAAFGVVGLDYREHVKSDPRLCRPEPKVPLVGDASKARKRLGWTYDLRLEDLVREMVESELEALRTPGREALGGGFRASEGGA